MKKIFNVLMLIAVSVLFNGLAFGFDGPAGSSVDLQVGPEVTLAEIHCSDFQTWRNSLSADEKARKGFLEVPYVPFDVVASWSEEDEIIGDGFPSVFISRGNSSSLDIFASDAEYAEVIAEAQEFCPKLKAHAGKALNLILLEEGYIAGFKINGESQYMTKYLHVWSRLVDSLHSK